jgi:hypothetical protein
MDLGDGGGGAGHEQDGRYVSEPQDARCVAVECVWFRVCEPGSVCVCSCKCISLTPCYWLSLLLCSIGIAAIRPTRTARTARIPRIAKAVSQVASIKTAANGTKKTRFGIDPRPCGKRSNSAPSSHKRPWKDSVWQLFWFVTNGLPIHVIVTRRKHVARAVEFPLCSSPQTSIFGVPEFNLCV